MKFYLILLTSFLLLVLSCKNEEIEQENPKKGETYFCGAEHLTEDGKRFISEGVEFNGGVSRSSDEAYEGSYSCVLDTNNVYGLTISINNLKPGEIFKVSVCRKSSEKAGALVLTSLDKSIYKSVKYGDELANGWELISFDLQLPMNVDSLDGLKIYAYNKAKSGAKAFFDNLLIKRESKYKSISNKYNEDEMSILLSDADYDTINVFRDKALIQDIISNNLKKEFDGLLKYQGKTLRISIRLKGDWTDHILGEKWSFRIKIKGGETIMGLKSFSIQSPSVRDFLHEWVIHEICKKEDLLTTRMDYVPVSINGMYYGVYNVEEHFNKQLLESRGRREGPILKFDEDALWDCRVNQIEPETDRPIYYASNIFPFNKSKTLKSNKLKNQFLIAQNLMLKYKTGAGNVSSYMDVEKSAKMYALMDVCNAKHGVIWWHNQRFYYNPITSRLEPIVFDCSGGERSYLRDSVKIFGNNEVGLHTVKLPEEYLIKNTFNDSIFLAYYIKNLKRYSNENYLDSIFAEMDFDLDSLNNILKEDYPNYSYDKNFVKKSAKKIRDQLPSYIAKSQKINYQLRDSSFNECYSHSLLHKYISLNVHLQKESGDGECSLSLLNYHCNSIKIIGYGSMQFPDSVLKLKRPITLIKFPNKREPLLLELPIKPERIYFEVEGDTNKLIHNVKLLAWPRPQLKLAQDELTKTDFNKASSIYEINGDKLIFKKGIYTVTENLIIRKGLKVLFEPGTELTFNNKTFFMSFSPVIMEGTKDLPIKISSSDSSAAGFSVLHAFAPSRLNHVYFDGLSNFSYEGWELTGAVTFYESEVSIINCSFNNNKSEDALNIVRSKFVFENSIISNTLSDGLDADFCEGKILNSRFTNLGNDGLDFSGSKIEINECSILNAGDKGVSCGENSTVIIKDLDIETAAIGISSKDQSDVKIVDVNLVNCFTGFSVFQKKSEYGPAMINIERYRLDKVTVPFRIEKNSKLITQKETFN